MNMRRPSCSALRWVTALTVLLVIPVTNARVFQRVGGGSAAKKLESAGATPAYQSRVTVNGVDADLAVFSFDEPLSSVTDRIKSVLGTNAMQEAAGGMATTELKDGDRPTHLMLSEVEGGKTLVFLMVLDRAPEPSSTPPWPITAVPLMPGSTTVFSFENASTRMRFAIAKTTDAPAAARAFCERHLKAKEWKPHGPSEASLVVYERKQDLCIVMVNSPSKPGENTRIAILEKRLGTP